MDNTYDELIEIKKKLIADNKWELIEEIDELLFKLAIAEFEEDTKDIKEKHE